MGCAKVRRPWKGCAELITREEAERIARQVVGARSDNPVQGWDLEEFKEGWLINDHDIFIKADLLPARAITVNKISDSPLPTRNRRAPYEMPLKACISQNLTSTAHCSPASPTAVSAQTSVEINPAQRRGRPRRVRPTRWP